jgi:hypothetical protein
MPHFNPLVCMNQKMVKAKILSLVYWIAIIAADIFIYMLLGVLQMDYDDNWDPSKGEYWSLASMNNRQIVFYLALQLWNVVNIIAIIFIGFRIVKFVKKLTTGGDAA